MPRRGRRRGDHGRGGGEPQYGDEFGDTAVVPLSAQDGDSGAARTKVFEKTKMCKFFILGCCTRGDACHFAHDKEQLTGLPDLFRTKLCRSLINTGRCDNEDCRYAHSKEELRVVPGFSGTIGNPKIAGDESGSGALGGAARPRAQRPGGAQDGPPQGRRGGATAAQRSQQPLDAAANMAAGMPQQGQLAASQAAVAAAMLQQMSGPQMEQAARTHMAEAMRLRAMAECLQNASVGTGGMGMPSGMLGASAGAVPAMMPMPVGFGATGVGGQVGMMPAMALQAGGAGGRRSAAGFPGYGQEEFVYPGAGAAAGFPMRPTPLPAHASVETAGPSGGQAWAGGASVKPAAAVGQTVSPQPADRIIPTLRGESEEAEAPAPATEPVQINPGSLRSLSSNSLTGLDPLAEEEPDGAFEERALAQFAAAAAMLEPGAPALAPSGVGGDAVEVTQGPTSHGGTSLSWKVKNTFLEYETGSTPIVGLRNICSAAGRLDALGRSASGQSLSRDAEDEVLAPAAPRGSEDVSDVSAHPGGAADLPANALLGGAWRAGDTSRVTVKNTFIDYAPEDPSPSMPLRAVHTAAGRLDMMAGQETPE